MAKLENTVIINKSIKILLLEGNVIETSMKPQVGMLHLHDKAIISGMDLRIETVKFDDVSLKKHHHVGTYIEVIISGKCILIFVPRVYINIGTGIAIINRSATRKLYEELISRYL